MPRNDVPPPRVLLEEVPDHLVPLFEAHAPTSQRVAAHAPIHDSDWDLLVTFANAVRRTGTYHVLAIGSTEATGFFRTQEDAHQLVRGEQIYARGAYISEMAPSPLRSLIDKSVVAPELEEAENPRQMWAARSNLGGMGWAGGIPNEILLKMVTPIVQVGQEGYVHAFLAERRWRRAQNAPTSQLWMLPANASHLDAWLRAFIEFLRELEPQRFPAPVKWRESADWGTAEVLRAVGALKETHEAHRLALAAMEAQEAAAAQELHQALQHAASGAQRLLTEQGDELVAAVASALREIGFSVQEMDEHHDARTGAKLEDLRVSDPDQPDWLVLAEVKGYTKGAKTSDVGQIAGRPATQYAIEAGRPASAVWHIVNHFRLEDPATRPTAIPDTAVDLKPLSDQGGMLIDTRDLFRALRDAVDPAARAAIRLSMRQGLGRWTYA